MPTKKASEKPKTTLPRTPVTWRSKAEWQRAKAAAGRFPLATFVLDVFIKELDRREKESAA